MNTETISLIGIVLNVTSVIGLLVTVIIMAIQTGETRRATYAGAFKAVYDILQTDEVRAARGVVLGTLISKPIDSWTDQEKISAEKVCFSYDTVGIMIRNNMVPVKVVADSWGSSLRRTWRILSPLVDSYRTQRRAPEFWDDFEWLAKQADRNQD